MDVIDEWNDMAARDAPRRLLVGDVTGSPRASTAAHEVDLRVPGSTLAETAHRVAHDLDLSSDDRVEVSLSANDLRCYDDESPFHADLVALFDALLDHLHPSHVAVTGIPASPEGDEGVRRLFNASCRSTCEMKGIGWTEPR